MPSPAVAKADDPVAIHAAAQRLAALLKSDRITADARERVNQQLQQGEPTLASIEQAIAELEDAELPF